MRSSRRPSYDPNEYGRYVQMSRKKHLLVEGTDDERFFDILLDEMCSDPNQRKTIIIDTAESLVAFHRTMGNRAKIEHVCSEVSSTPYANRFVGFVDREYRDFDLGYRLADNLGKHKLLGRLVWSRGHSIENYLFDFAILRVPFQELFVGRHYKQALGMFQALFQDALRLACALGLTGHEYANLGLIQGSVVWQVLQLSTSVLELDVKAWQATLEASGLDRKEVRRITDIFRRQYAATQEADVETARWLCHGHIGWTVLWAAYCRCAIEACKSAGIDDPDTHLRKCLRTDKSIRLNACVNSWVDGASHRQCPYPTEVLVLLGVDISETPDGHFAVYQT